MDPVNIAAHIVLDLQEVIAREIAAVKPAVLTIGKFQAGDTYNIIPNEVLLEGTIRALDASVRQEMARRLGEIAQETARTFRGEIEYEMIWGAPPVINDANMTALACACAKEVVGEDRVMDQIEDPIMVGEDFAYYAEKIPAAFLFLSSSNKGKGTDVPHHNERFNVDEDVLWIGSALFVKIAEKFLA